MYIWTQSAYKALLFICLKPKTRKQALKCLRFKKKKKNVKWGRETIKTDFFLNTVQIGAAQKLFLAAHSCTVAFAITVGGLSRIFSMLFSVVPLPVTHRKVMGSLSRRTEGPQAPQWLPRLWPPTEVPKIGAGAAPWWWTGRGDPRARGMEDAWGMQVCVLLPSASFRVWVPCTTQAQVGAQPVVPCLFPGISGTVLSNDAFPVHPITSSCGPTAIAGRHAVTRMTEKWINIKIVTSNYFN